MQDRDVAGDLPGAQAHVRQHPAAVLETGAQRGFAAIAIVHQQARLQTQAPRPAALGAPGDEIGAAVEPVAHQHRPNAPRQPPGDLLQQLALVGEPDRAAGLANQPGQRQRPAADRDRHHQDLMAMQARRLALIDHENRLLPLGAQGRQDLPRIGRHHLARLDMPVGQDPLELLEPAGPVAGRHRQRRAQGHQVDVAFAQQDRGEQGEIAPLRHSLLRQTRRKIRLDRRRYRLQPAHRNPLNETPEG
ncbi:MAG: hypothetical protein U5L06_13250 [Rhodovibrio sp.]|nr:hypothetical protein [Rhodovibrio sp.]